jgi:hypothetical protein
MSKMLRSKYAFLLLLLFQQPTIFADQSKKFSILQEGKINVQIGSKSHNRISFKGERIREIIGDERLYQIIYPTFKNHIFLIPKSDDIKLINLSIITESNLVLDLVLEVVQTSGKILNIEVSKS